MKTANLILWATWLAASAIAAAAEPTHEFTVDDYFSLAAVMHLAVSPDGPHAASWETRWQQSSDDRKAKMEWDLAWLRKYLKGK